MNVYDALLLHSIFQFSGPLCHHDIETLLAIHEKKVYYQIHKQCKFSSKFAECLTHNPQNLNFSRFYLLGI